MGQAGFNAEYIHTNGELEPHSEVMDRLLEVHKLDHENEGFFLVLRKELIVAAIGRQSKRAAYVEEEPAAQDIEKDPRKFISSD